MITEKYRVLFDTLIWHFTNLLTILHYGISSDVGTVLCDGSNISSHQSLKKEMVIFSSAPAHVSDTPGGDISLLLPNCNKLTS